MTREAGYDEEDDAGKTVMAQVRHACEPRVRWRSFTCGKLEYEGYAGEAGNAEDQEYTGGTGYALQ